MPLNGLGVQGIWELLLAAAFLGLIWLLLRTVPRIQPPALASQFPPSDPTIPAGNDAVLLIEPGGRVLYTNPVAREWFNYTRLDDEPNLERLARRARPSETFWSLCNGNAQGRFSLDGRIVEGTSYHLPFGGQSQVNRVVVVTLRRPQVTAITSDQNQLSDQALNIFAELTQEMAANLDLEATLLAILEGVERLIQSDFPEITVWDADKQELIPYRFVGVSGVDRRLEKAAERYYPDKGYAGYLITRREPLLIGNVDTYRAVRPTVNRKQYPFNSYLGIPLLFAGELMGTIELASLSQNAFSDNDLQVLRILSGQASIALHNALIFRHEQRRVRELSGLAKLAHAVSASNDSQNLFARLVESIRPLLDVKILGFLVYNENRRLLVAQDPFVGLPSQMVEIYRVPISPNSPAEGVIFSQQTIVAPNAPENPTLEALGVTHLAQAASIASAVFVPLNSAGRFLGYLQAADKTEGTPFDQDDLRLLEIIAVQAATIIENATLVLQTQERAQRAEALRRIASLTGSVATLDEILQFSLRELARLLQADIAAIFLLDEARGELRLHRDSLFGAEQDTAIRFGRIAMSSPDFRLTATGRKRPYFIINLADENQLPPFYLTIGENFALQSFMTVPLIVRDQGMGEILLGSKAVEFFDRSELIMVSTIGSQLAAAIEKSSLYTQTDDSLRRRVEQLTAFTRISREISATLELKRLLQLVYDELLRTTQANCGTILLFDPSNGTNPTHVAFYVGDAPADSLNALEHYVVKNDEPLLVNDFSEPQELFGNAVLEAPHTGVLSCLVAPIAYQENVAGLISLHARLPGRFDDTSLEIAQTLALQAAIAFGNAQRYHEQLQRSELLNRRVETLARLLEASQSLHVDSPLEQSLETIAYGIQESTPFDIILISIFDAEKQRLERLVGVGMPLSTFNELRSRGQSWEAIEELLQPPFRFSHSYYVPHDKRPATIASLYTVTLMPGVMSGVEEEKAWHPNDFLIVPLLSTDGRPLGLISVDSPRNGLRPDRPTIESLEIFASQATFIIESYQKLQELKYSAAAVRQDMERMQLAVDAQQVYLPTLLHKDVEQTVAIQRLNQSVRRVRAGLDIAEIVNRQPNRSNALLALGQEILTHMVEMDVVLVVEPGPGGARLLHILGEVPPTVNPDVLLGQRHPLRHSLQTGQPVLVANIEDNEWQNSPLLVALETKSFLCLPITIESGVDSAVLAISHTPLPPLTPEDEQLYSLLIRQVSIALENLRLLMQTNRRLQEVNLLLEFSRQMGSLETKNILQTLVDSALQVVPAAHAAIVALWRPEEGVLVPQVASGYMDNQSMLQITYRPGEALPGQAFQQGQPLRVDEVDFTRHYNLSSENLMRYRDAAEGRLPVSNLIIPIHTFDNKLGVMVMDNFKTPAAFTEDDQALVSSLARQTALALENARLFQASEQRTAQLQALTDVAATITSSLQSDELIASLLDQVKVILPYETGTLWLRQGGQMTIRAAHGFEDSDQRIGLSVAVEDSLLLKEMITTTRPISVGDVREDARFPSLIEPRYFSWLGVPLLSKGEVVGVIALEKSDAGFYTPEHIQAMTTFAGQAAVALENAALFEESARRTLEVDRRSQRLALLNRLSTELSGSLDAVYILRVATQELSRAINCTAASALLMEYGERISVQAEAPATTPTLPLALPHAPIFARLSESHGVFSTEDINAEPDLAPLIGYLSIRKTRALLALPLVTGGEFHGLLFAHHNKSYRFTADEVELARTISNQAAVAVQNARLFAETQRLFAETELRSAELTTLYELGVSFSEVLDTRRLMDIAFDKLLKLVKADTVMLVTLDEGDSLIIHGIDQGERIGPVMQSRGGTSFSEHVLATGHPLMIGDTQNRETLPVTGQNIGSPVRSWLGAPLIVRGVAVGVISVQSYKPSAFGDAEQRLLIQVANQLAVSLDNARLFASAQNYAADLEQRVSERTEQVEAEHRRTQTLLGIITELSSSLDMDLVLSRTLKVINDTVGSDHSLIMLVNPDQATLQLRASLGYSTSPVPKGGQQSWIRPNEGLAGWVIRNRQSALVSDLWSDPRWIRRDDATDQHRSAIVVPLAMGEETLGALLLFHRQKEYFSMDQLELAQGAAKQIAVAINNAQLFRLIRDQAEHLGDMLRTQHIETSRSQAILEAVADGVLVTDAARKITLFNASAEKILGLERGQVLGQSLEHFSGLFAKAAQAWSQTVRVWSEDPASYQPGDSYAEQIVLDNNRVISVALSPVRLRSDFLGTVSIFRDITHMVEVDRLKSEFVATVSHELRTPMTSIKGYVEIMLMGATGTLSEQQTHFLQVVKTNTERLAVLVNDLLDISRIEAGRATLSLQPLELDKIVTESINALVHRSQDENRPMSFEVNIPPELPHAYGDVERVRQIVDNLLENGYQYTPDGGRVELTARVDGEEIQVDVTDNGIGIPPADQPRIFERFYRGEDPLVLATSGTGLGLSIVRHLVEMHKGRIWMKSSGVRGEGSTFSFTLPVYNPEKHVQEG